MTVVAQTGYFASASYFDRKPMKLFYIMSYEALVLVCCISVMVFIVFLEYFTD